MNITRTTISTTITHQDKPGEMQETDPGGIWTTGTYVSCVENRATPPNFASNWDNMQTRNRKCPTTSNQQKKTGRIEKNSKTHIHWPLNQMEYEGQPMYEGHGYNEQQEAYQQE